MENRVQGLSGKVLWRNIAIGAQRYDTEKLLTHVSLRRSDSLARITQAITSSNVWKIYKRPLEGVEGTS